MKYITFKTTAFPSSDPAQQQMVSADNVAVVENKSTTEVWLWEPNGVKKVVLTFGAITAAETKKFMSNINEALEVAAESSWKNVMSEVNMVVNDATLLEVAISGITIS